MSKFLIKEYKNLKPYTPGEQPKERKYIKLNTNESPFPPSKKGVRLANKALKSVQLYSDPECKLLVKTYCEKYGLKENQVLFTNGSDEILNFAFMAFCDKEKGAAFADITYGFYSVFASINKVPYTLIPLKEDFTISVKDYKNLNKTIFIANPNAPTGIYLTLEEIESVLKSNKKSVVVIDEAYIDFGGESAVSLINKYDNLLVTQTFSKSRSMAGARLGVGIANEKLIEDLNKITIDEHYGIATDKYTLGAGKFNFIVITTNTFTGNVNEDFVSNLCDKLFDKASTYEYYIKRA
jgi:histidinol-phosphate aminotransferase